MGSETLPAACYIISDESSKPFYSTSNGYKYDDDEKELDDFYFTTNEKDLQSNRNITPPRSFGDSDSYNEFFSQTNIEEDIEDEKKEMR